MADLGTMSVGLGLDTSDLQNGLGKAGDMLKGFAGPIGIGAAAVIGLGVATTKMAGDFQESMTQLVTGAGESQSNIKMVSAGVLQLARDTGTSTAQMASGLYMIESAGYHGAAGLDILRNAAQGAKVGNADLGTVADATTTILNDFGKTGVTSAQAVNILISTVAQGKTHMEDLAGALAQILPTASAAGVGLNDVMGAMATMTSEGIPAANAATYLRQTIISLEVPGSAAKNVLNEIGISSSSVAKEMQVSLPGALAMITDALGKKFPVGSAAYVAALKDISGGSKTMQGLLDLTGDHLATFQGAVASVSGTVKTAGSSIQGWGDVQKDFNFKVSQAKEVVETLAISVGTKLLPIAGDLFDIFSHNVVPIFTTLIGIFDQVSTVANNAARPILDLKKVFDEGTAAAARIGNTVKTIIPPFDEGSRAINGVMSAVKVIVPPIDEGSRAVSRLAGETKTAVTPIQAIANTFIKDVVPSVKSFAVFVVSDVLPVVSQLGSWIMTKVMPAAMQMAGWFDKQIMPILKTFWTVLAHDVIPQVETIADAVMKDLIPPLEHIGSKILPILNPLLQGVGFILGHVVGPAIGLVVTVLGGLLGAVGWIIDRIGDLLGLLGHLKDFIVDGLIGTFKNIQTVASTVFGALFNIIRGPVNLIIDMVNFLIGALDSIQVKIPDWVPLTGGKTFGINIPKIPHLASGGTMASSGLALVGEKGPEVVSLPGGSRVFPNGQTPTGNNGGNQYHVHVTNQAPTVEDVLNGFRRLELMYG